MIWEKRIQLLSRLGTYMSSSDEEWQAVKENAAAANSWFTPEHINLAVENITAAYLQPDLLRRWLSSYQPPEKPVNLGIVMAGNIPLVGFHDFLCGFLCGHSLHIKLSSKDAVLLPHLMAQLARYDPAAERSFHLSDQLRGCDAYIATGSNNTSRYFEAYFGKYPHIIRKNRTSVAVLDGSETDEDLLKLGQDVFLYFGLGCRNVTKIYVPEAYDFTRLLRIWEAYGHSMQHHKYKHNFDYHLSLFLLNNIPVYTNNTVLLVENALPFAAVSVLHYEHYNSSAAVREALLQDDRIQAIAGHGYTPFGNVQKPSLQDDADGIDTMKFVSGLRS